MSKHTPGPWYHDGGITIRAEDMLPLCRVPTCDDYDEARANAALIAAAPDMLAALEGLSGAVEFRIDDPRVKLHDAARAAIAKARGEA